MRGEPEHQESKQHARRMETPGEEQARAQRRVIVELQGRSRNWKNGGMKQQGGPAEKEGARYQQRFESSLVPEVHGFLPISAVPTIIPARRPTVNSGMDSRET